MLRETGSSPEHLQMMLDNELKRINALDANDPQVQEMVRKYQPHALELGRLAEGQIVKHFQDLKIFPWIEQAPASLDFFGSKVDIIAQLPSSNLIAVQVFTTGTHIDKKHAGDLKEKYIASVRNGIRELEGVRHQTVFRGLPMPIAIMTIDREIILDDDPKTIAREFLRQTAFGFDPAQRKLLPEGGGMSPSEFNALRAYQRELAQLRSSV